MINGISGIKRKTTAIESTYRFFQTVDLIISHFKRDADKQKIYELVNHETTLNGFLIATAAIHIYHNLGIRVQDDFESDQMTVDSTRTLELKEKKILKEEVESLLKNSFNLEIEMINIIINLENKFISFLIEGRKSKLKNFQKEQKLKEIEDQIEYELLQIIRNYPPFCFYDLIGDLIGLTNVTKMEILEESSGLKDLSIEIEKKLEKEDKEDKYIELSTLNRLITKLQKNFEFKSYKELQIQAMPVRMIKKKIIGYEIDRFPISVPGLNAFLKANNLKKDLIAKIKNALNEKINYDQFEHQMLAYLKIEIIKQLKTNPNDFIYFLQKLNETNFSETIYILNKYGIHNILHLLKADEELSKKINQNMIRYNIKKFDIMSLNDPNKDLIYLAKKAICNLDFPILKDAMKTNHDSSEFNLFNLLNQDSIEAKESWKLIEKEINYSKSDFREFVRKKEIIDKIFLRGLKIRDYSQILLLMNFETILENIVKNIFFYLLSKILRQLGRIIEIYLKVTNERGLSLLALKKMQGTTDSEEWVNIKLEELLIERINKRQNELVTVFNAMTQPFLVNGFIFARFKNIALKTGISEMKNTTSPVYEGILPLKLQAEYISPVSYCIAYDLVKRFEKYVELHKIKIEKIIESKEKVKEEKKKELRKKQEGSTFNWIERRITSALMRINSPGINPTLLYWQKKDTKSATDNIKLHSELQGNTVELFSEFFIFCIEKIKSFSQEFKLPDNDKIIQMVNKITEKTLKERLGRVPTSTDVQNMIEGERYEIAKQIAKRIGKFLDKALYTKFKNKRKNN